MNNRKIKDLIPRDIHRQTRHEDVCRVISGYYDAGLKIPIEWVEEYNEFLDK